MEKDIKRKDLISAKDFENMPKPTIPYQTILSFKEIIGSWENKLNSEDEFTRLKAQHILKKVEENPILRQNELNEKDLIGKEEIIKQLFSDSYSVDQDERVAFAVSAPFGHSFIYKSKRFEEIYQNAVFCEHSLNKLKESNPKLMNAFATILTDVYGAELNAMDIPYVLPCIDPETGLGKFYKFNLEYNGCGTVIAKKNHQEKDFEELCFSKLTHNYDSPEQWLEYLPADEYAFEGVSLITLIDITEQESLNQIQHLLLKNSTITQKVLAGISKLISDFLESAGAKVGIIALDKNLNTLKAEKKFGLSILHENGIDLTKEQIIQMANKFESGSKLIFIDQNEPDPICHSFHKILNQKGIRNLILMPMYNENRMIGIFELSLPQNHIFSAFYVNKLYRLLPMFELALDRSVETVNNKIQQIIKDHCTAIHPSVEWRFIEGAVKLYDQNLRGSDSDEMEEIIFENVMPIYGLSDIRNSSVQRAATIKEDLYAQLKLAKKTLTELDDSGDYLIFESLNFSIDQKIAQLDNEAVSSEEEDIYGFLENEINKLLQRLRTDFRYDKNIIDQYLNALDPTVGILYNRRKDFDHSVSLINQEIRLFLDREQEKLQQIYPHYFDKYQTDGIDYNIYIGQSIAPHLPFHKVYLKNMRLWQLSSMCKIVYIAHHLRDNLPLPLQTAQLILVQNLPINIKFRYEEKRFDIDSAYNARYEIVKKRIDKATVLETGERLTQPGKIAIVYNNASTRREYDQYIRFLQQKEILTGEIEYLNLDKLQGAEELKAIRLSVNVNSKGLNDEWYTEKLLQKIQL